MSPRPLLIASTVCVVLAVLAWALAVRPLNAQQVALQAETADLEAQRALLEGELAELQMVQEDELRIRAALTRQEALIPLGDPAQPSFVRAVQQAGDLSGAAIGSLVFASPVAVAGAVPVGADNLVLSEIGVTMTLTGGYFQVVDFLRRLEVEVARGIAVDAVNFFEAEDGFPELSATVTGRLFAQLPVVVAPPPAPAPGTDTAPAPGATPQPGSTAVPAATPAEVTQ